MKKIDELVSKNMDDLVHNLQELVRIKSVQGGSEAPFGIGPKKALEYALNLCNSLGFKTKNVDNYVGWAEIGEGEEIIGIPVHLDVVPEGSGWDYDPYGATIEDGVIYGRGAMDNKSGAIESIYALKIIREMEVPLNKRVRILFGTNEETGMECMKYYLNSGEEIPDMGFVPDASYPICNGEKGRLHLRFRKEMDIDKNKVYITMNGGEEVNSVPDKCEIVIHNLEGLNFKNSSENIKVTEIEGNTIIEIKGIAAHGSTPEKGKNAISMGLNLLSKLDIDGENIYEIKNLNRLLGQDTNGSSLNIYSKDELFGENTVNLGLLSMEKDSIEFEIDIRYGKAITGETIEDKLNKIFVDYEIKLMGSKKPTFVDQDSPLVQTLLKVYEEMFGEKGYCYTMGGGTYASCFKNMVAFGPGIPGVRSYGHGKNERVRLEHLEFNTKVYATAILKLL